ncbi:MAG: hypothetical protein AB8B86_09130 [Pseudomonadales bacterium]
MKIFYVGLAAIYGSWFAWYGGTGEAVTQDELNAYVKSVSEKSSSGPVKIEEATKLMHRLAAFDTGNEFLMVNLIKYRAKAAYPESSEWANETDALAADARYSRGVLKELFKRGSLPILKASVIGVFMIDEDWRDWDDVVIVRYRSVHDMLDMIVGMADSGLSVHKYASIQQTHVFPAEPVFSLFSIRLLFALLLITFALVVRLLVNRI